MKRYKEQWGIWILIVLLAIAGCSYLFPSERSKLERKLGEFKRASTKAFDIIRSAEKKDSDTFADEISKPKDEMGKATDEFWNLVKQSKDKKLVKDAKLCYQGMKKILLAVENYEAANERYLMFKNSVVPRFAESAKKGKKEAFKKFKDERDEGQKMIDDSGL